MDIAEQIYSDAESRSADRLRVVLCGSFRREPDALNLVFRELGKHYAVLSPASLGFVDPGADFVRLANELEESIDSIEGRHLSAISQADFVWLHCPAGYVGPSAALELGHAKALGIPVLSSEVPEDQTLAAFVVVVDGPRAAENALQVDPGSGLVALQSYYRRTAARRGWSNESARDTLLLITEEVGELARAVRKAEGLSRSGGYAGVDAAEELADVQLYLVHLANALGIDLATAVSDKERINEERHSQRVAAA